MQERLELVEKLQQMLWRADTLPEVEGEQAQRVAALSKVLLWVPAGQARGGPVPVLSHRTPARAAQSTQDRRRGGHAARLRWERSLNVRQPPLLRHPCVNFPRFVPCSVCPQDASAPSHSCSEFSQPLKA